MTSGLDTVGPLHSSNENKVPVQVISFPTNGLSLSRDTILCLSGQKGFDRLKVIGRGTPTFPLHPLSRTLNHHVSQSGGRESGVGLGVRHGHGLRQRRTSNGRPRSDYHTRGLSEVNRMSPGLRRFQFTVAGRPPGPSLIIFVEWIFLHLDKERGHSSRSRISSVTLVVRVLSVVVRTHGWCTVRDLSRK